MREEGRETRIHIDERYTQWKSLVPLLYDWLANHNLVWPSLSCRWGPQLEQATYKNRQRLYLSEQTDGSVPNTLVIANCEVVKPRVAAAEHISHFNEEARSPFVKKFKTIIHPGEVNRIRELPQNSKIVATHTDSPDVLIWDVESQPNRHAVLGATASRPDLILTGHQDNAEFALALSPIEPLVLSGGRDKSVVLWSINDHISTLASDAGSSKSTAKQVSKTGVSSEKSGDAVSIEPRGIFQGHDDIVEDVQFCPSSAQEFCSVGDDSCLILWDTRTGLAPAQKVEKAHDADLHCVDWNPHDINFILTGSADSSVRMFDRRKLTSGGVGSPIHKFENHDYAVLCVQWCPDKTSIFGSAAEDGILNIWDYEKIGKKVDPASKSNAPPGLFFRHAGHRDKVVDFHWNSSDPWTIVSVSDDGESTGGGGTLQIWRMIDLLYRPEEEVLEELNRFKSHTSTCVMERHQIDIRQFATNWTPPMEDVMVDAFFIQVTQGQRIDGTFTMTGYNDILAELEITFPTIKWSKEMIKTHINTTRKTWRSCYDVFKNLSGFSWSPASYRWDVKSEVLEELILTNSDTTRWKNKSIGNYNNLAQLWENDRAGGGETEIGFEMNERNRCKVTLSI